MPLRLFGRRNASHLFLATIVIVGSLIAGAPARAQLPLLQPAEQPGPFVREAFAAPYGRALVAELGKSLRASVDPACLQAKGLSDEQLIERGEALIVTWGTRTMEQLASLFDAKAHEAKFTAIAGAGAAAELARLRENDDVKRYLAIERPWRLARAADFVMEQLDRYALLARLKLTPVSPVAGGNDALLRQNPTETIEAELDAFREKTKSDALERYLELEEASGEAVPAALRPEAARAGPATFMRGIEDDLAAVCIVKR